MATVINFISPFSQLDAYIHKLLDIDIWFLATTRKLRKSPAFQFLVLAVNHFVLIAILNTCNISIKYIPWYVYLVCYIHCIYSRRIRWPRFLHPYRNTYYTLYLGDTFHKCHKGIRNISSYIHMSKTN